MVFREWTTQSALTDSPHQYSVMDSFSYLEDEI